MPRWQRILVHHSAGRDSSALDYEGILRFHTTPAPAGRGWRDIGYHYLVERLGSSFVGIVGRPEALPGAHCPGQNGIALGVCLVGNFELEPPPDGQIEQLTALAAALCLRHRIPPAEIRGHREYRATACPGRHLFDLLPIVRSRVAATIADHTRRMA